MSDKNGKHTVSNMIEGSYKSKLILKQKIY